MTLLERMNRARLTEEERIADIKAKYRKGRSSRSRWYLVCELYLPLPASALGTILDTLADLHDRVVVRENPVNPDILYIGWYEDAASEEFVDIPTALAPGQFDQDDPARP